MDDIGDSFTYSEGIDLIEGLQETLGSRTHAAAARWAYPMTQAEIAAQGQLLAFTNVNRDPKSHPRPFTFPWPWPGEDDVTPEELEELTQQLIRRSALAALP